MSLLRIYSGMTKKLIDLDEDKLNQVRLLLGVATAKAAVNGALDEVIALAARREALLNGDAVAGSADLVDDEKRRAAWA
jgi:Arc/MetJ family transcription regulator